MPNLIGFDSRVNHIEKIFNLLKTALREKDKITAIGASEGVWEALNNMHDAFSIYAPENFELNGMRSRLLKTVIRPLKDFRLTDLSNIILVVDDFYDDFQSWVLLANKSDNFRKSYFKGLVFGVKRILINDIEAKIRKTLDADNVHYRVESELDDDKSGKIIVDIEVDSSPNVHIDQTEFERIVVDMKNQVKKQLISLGFSVGMINTDIRGRFIIDSKATIVVPFASRGF